MIRKVITQKSRYKYFTITADENRFVVRILCPSLGNDVCNATLDDVLGTSSLKGLSIKFSEGKIYDVVAEGVFDKTTNPKLWKTGATLTFYVTPNSIARGTVEVADLDGLVDLYNESETEYHARNGNTVLAKVYCADKNKALNQTDAQILVDTTGELYCNLDLSQSTDCDVFDYRFGFGFSLYLPKEIKADSKYTVGVLGSINETPLNGCVYLDTTGGYLPNRMVKLTDGKGVFAFFTEGLNQGDTLDLSVGSRRNPHKLTATIEVA